MKFKNIAFTLAETLVVMGIIGVIAALTIPNLSQSTGNRERVTKVKKLYANISEAYERATAIYGPIDEWFTSSMSVTDNTTRLGDRLCEFMKISKKEAIKTATSENGTTLASYTVYTADGSKVNFWYDSDLVTMDTSRQPLQISFNIDGTKDNGYGKSKFLFCVYKKDNQLAPYGRFHSTTDFLNDMKKGGARYNAAVWVLNYDNMDYLKVDENWKCPNGTVLNITATPPVTSCN